MTRYRQPNQKKIYDELNKRLAKYVSLVQSIYDTLNLEASKIALGVDYDGNKPFSFRDFPSTKERILKVQKAFVSNLRSLIYRGTSDEWKRSNLMQDLLVDGVMKYYEGETQREKHKKYYRTNSEQLKAFQERKDRGLNLSAKLWNQSKEYKTGLEAALSNAIEKGQSAVTLSKRVSKYLKDFPSMQKDYKEKFGTASNAKDCQYMSMRLARSEINMAYRTAEQTRWRQLDFVVGYEIKLSGSHPKHDICDQLKGLYPKDFVWTGWHPNDMCYVVSRLKTWDEFENDDDTSVNAVNDVPEKFKKWCEENRDYIDKARAKGTLPYFLKDNPSVLTYKSKKGLSEEGLNELTQRGLKFVGFGQDIVDTYKKSIVGNLDINKLDSIIEEVCDECHIDIDSREIKMLKNGNVYLNYYGQDENGEGFCLERAFIQNGGKKIVRHDRFSIPEEYQGKGYAKKIFRCIFEQYQNIGVDEVQLFANMDIGGYAWAKYGFSASKYEAMNIVTNSYQKGLIDESTSSGLIKDITRYNGEYFPMDYIANKEYGKTILLGSRWDGYLELKDEVQLSKLKEYIGLK